MEKFIDLIQRVHQERYSVVISKIISEKIPIAFLTVTPIQTAIESVNNLRSQGLNITNLITNTPPHTVLA